MKSKGKQKSGVDFKVGDLVAARVKGHPIWPAEVTEVNVTKGKQVCTVKFFGTHETSKSCAEIRFYSSLTEKERTKSIKSFQKAVQECDALYKSRQRDNTSESPDEEPTHGESPKNAEETEQLKSPTSTSPSVHDEPNLSIVEEDVPKLCKTKKPVEAKKRKSSVTSIKKERTKKEKVTKEAKQNGDSTATTTNTSMIDDANVEKIEDKLTSMTIDSVTVKAETQSQQANNSSELPKPETELKSEGENEDQTTIIRENTIKKLKKKLNEKMEEKQTKKEAVLEVKRLKKIKKVLDGATDNLIKFSNMSEKILQINSFNKIELIRWNKARQLFEENTLKMLDECVKRDPRGKLSVERRLCHEKLLNLISILKQGNGSSSEQLPEEIKSGFSLIVKQIRGNKLDLALIPAVFGTRNKIMLERRENDAE